MKYFTKYLPVEGEIKEMGKTSILYKGMQKVKLFLCSRDIQVGDRDVYLDGVIKINIQNKENLRVAKKTELTFKIIGEVSPNATWVKEGMEFNEDQYKMNDYGYVLFKCPICFIFH